MTVYVSSACFLRCGGCVLVNQWQCVTIIVTVYVSSACFLRCGGCVLVNQWQCVTIIVTVYVSSACFLRCGGCVVVSDSVWPYLWQCKYLVFASSGVEAVYYLESVSLWRKYLWVFDLPFTLFFSSHVCVLGPLDILRAQVNLYLFVGVWVGGGGGGSMHVLPFICPSQHSGFATLWCVCVCSTLLASIWCHKKVELWPLRYLEHRFAGV